MADKKFHEYIYNIENWVDEFAIVFLSFGTIFVFIYSMFYASQNVGIMTLGKIIEPWVTMLALMLIARELWLMNRNMERRGE